MYDRISDKGNPFLDDSKDLLILDSGNCVDECNATTECVVGAKGSEAYQMYIEEVM